MMNASEIAEIRRNVREGIEQVDRGESTEYEGEKGNKQFLRDIKVEGLKQLAAERRKKRS